LCKIVCINIVVYSWQRLSNNNLPLLGLLVVHHYTISHNHIITTSTTGQKTNDLAHLSDNFYPIKIFYTIIRLFLSVENQGYTDKKSYLYNITVGNLCSD